MKALKRIFNIASIALVMTVITSSCSEGLLGDYDEPNIGNDKKIFECCGTVMGNKAYGYFVYPDKHTSPFIKTIYMAPGTDLGPIFNPSNLADLEINPVRRIHMIYRCEPGGLEPIYSYSSKMEYAAHDAELISAEAISRAEVGYDSSLLDRVLTRYPLLPATRLIDVWGEAGFITFITSIDATNEKNEGIYVNLIIDEEKSTDDTLALIAYCTQQQIIYKSVRNQLYCSIVLKPLADRYKDKEEVKVQIYGQDGLLKTLELKGSDFLSPLD